MTGVMFTPSSYGRGEQTLEELGGQPAVIDTGWVDVPLTNTTDWQDYNVGRPPKVRKLNNQVWFHGALYVLTAGNPDATSTGATQLFTVLPAEFYPPVDWVDPVWVCQASGTNRWALRIGSSTGNCYAHRYGPAASVVGNWLPFNVTWLTD